MTLEQRAAVRDCVVGLGVFAVLATLAALSTGTYHDDDLTHVLFAREAWNEHRLFLDAWGRPGFTLPYALVAWVGDVATGMLAARLLSAVFVVATAALVRDLAARLGASRPWIAAAAWLAMPLVFRSGFAALTETPAAFYTALGATLIARGRPALGAAALSLLATARLEAALPLAALGALWLVRPPAGSRAAALWLAAGPLAWNLAAWLVFDEVPARIYFTRHTGITEAYGAGSPTFYLVRSVEASGLGVLVLAAAGLGRAAGPPVLRALVNAGWPAWLALQTWLYWQNDHASGGYARFLVPALPLAAVAAALGADTSRRRRTLSAALVALTLAAALGLDRQRLVALAPAELRALVAAGVAGAALACAALALGAGAAAATHRAFAAVLGTVAAIQGVHLAAVVRPFTLTPVQEAVGAAVLAARRDHPGRPLYAWNVWAGYFDRVATGTSSIHWLRTESLGAWADAPPGALLVWDAHRARLDGAEADALRRLAHPAWPDACADACVLERRDVRAR